MNLVGWKAWVTNNPEGVGWRTFDSTETAYTNLPADGIISVLKYGDHGLNQALSGGSFYFWWEGPDGLVVSNENDTDIAERYPGATICRGRNVTDQIMEDADAEMMSEAAQWHADHMKTDCPTCG